MLWSESLSALSRSIRPTLCPRTSTSSSGERRFEPDRLVRFGFLFVTRIGSERTQKVRPISDPISSLTFPVLRTSPRRAADGARNQIRLHLSRPINDPSKQSDKTCRSLSFSSSSQHSTSVFCRLICILALHFHRRRLVQSEPVNTTKQEQLRHSLSCPDLFRREQQQKIDSRRYHN
jgi:hypothetical protein